MWGAPTIFSAQWPGLVNRACAHAASARAAAFEWQALYFPMACAPRISTRIHARVKRRLNIPRETPWKYFLGAKQYPMDTGNPRCIFLVRTPLFGVLDNRFAVLWCAVPLMPDVLLVVEQIPCQTIVLKEC
nr:hypothetical protein [Delftia acidovorans]